MIELVCGCKKPRQVPENGTGRAYPCSQCGLVIYPISAETLGEGNGDGDFDATLSVIEGPAYVGEMIQLGGVVDIELGKSGDRQISLPGTKVSRLHAKLVRMDFGPSRWKVVDHRSTNGLFVNDVRVAEHELQDGDEVRIGEFILRYGHVAAVAAPVAAAASAQAGDGLPCPSCEKVLGKKAKICVDCGINIASGRPILTRQGVDENALYAGAEPLIRLISLIVWVTPFPIPLRSEAFGTRKPYAIWTIAFATILASVTFFVAQFVDGSNGVFPAGANLMLWPPSNGVPTDLDPASIPQFQAYQLITNIFLHDPSSVIDFLMHLGGNLVFMLCFGTRVNALIGNVAMFVLYPVLAVASDVIYLATLGPGFHGPSLGASGAIMGLAGMYLILFPVHNVFCAMWISVWFFFRRFLGCKIFSLRGFWILLIYFGYDIAMNYLNARDGVAHWAHIGGFATGMFLGLAVLLSRMFETHGGDMLSVMLGRHAWAIIGKPGRNRRAAEGTAIPAYA